MGNQFIRWGENEYQIEPSLAHLLPEGYTSWKEFQDHTILADARKDLSTRRQENEHHQEVILLGENKAIETPFTVHTFVQNNGENYMLGIHEEKKIAILMH